MTNASWARADKILSRLGRSGMKFELGRIRSALASLGDPQNKFPAVHIAGTNGKGSVGAMLESILKDQGFRTALITSPHLNSPVERFRLNGKPISRRNFASYVFDLDKHLREKRRIRLTQFEFLTVVSYRWIADLNVDVAIVETGLGGRLDATNVMGDVRCSIITNIALEHTDWLGNTIPKIAREKAGIIKPGVPVVTGAKGRALDVIQKAAAQEKARVMKCPTGPAVHSNLKGIFQKQNAAIAMAAVRVLSRLWPLNLEKARKSLKHVDWPGRFDCYRVNRRTVVLDGAHNPSAVSVLMKSLRASGIGKFDLLFGVLSDKDARSMARLLSSGAASVHLAPLPSVRSARPASLAKLREWDRLPRAHRSIQKGWKAVLKDGNRCPILVTGSLYLVGAIREKLLKNKPIRLLNRSNLNYT